MRKIGKKKFCQKDGITNRLNWKVKNVIDDGKLLEEDRRSKNLHKSTSLKMGFYVHIVKKRHECRRNY